MILSAFLAITVAFASGSSDPAAGSTASVRMVRNFLTTKEAETYRRKEKMYERIPANGFSGNRTWGGAHLGKRFFERIYDTGAGECLSESLRASLPRSGVDILTNHVTESTDAHVDYNPITLERIASANDVGVVFLNSNEDATFFVGKEEFPVEEGTLLMFAGGLIPHHIEMAKEDGFVHMLGPFEIGGSFGIVGQINARRDLEWYADGGTAYGGSTGYTFWSTSPLRKLAENETRQVTNQTPWPITGQITMMGYKDGIDQDGNKNHTLEVAYDLEGFDPSCEESCFYVKLKDGSANFCDELGSGRVDSDDPDITERTGSNQQIWDEIVATADDDGKSQGVANVNIKFPVNLLFNYPMVIYNSTDGTILNCGIFKEIAPEADDGEIDTKDISGGNVSSPATAGVVLGLATVVAVASIF